MSTRKEQFALAYAGVLVAAMKRDPSGWMDTPATAPDLARRMTDALARGAANLSPQGKAAAKLCGVHPTQKAIRAWLAGEG